MRQKKYWIIGAVIALAAVAGLWRLTAADSGGNGLFSDVKPSEGKLSVYSFDGTTGQKGLVTDEKTVKRFLKALDSVEVVPAEQWEPAYPMYSVVFDRNGSFTTLQVLWTNGYLITFDGDVYAFDFDFAAVVQELETAEDSGWQTEGEITSVKAMPNRYYLARRNGEWHTEFLTPAAEPKTPEGVYMTMKQAEDGRLTVTMHNESAEGWSYGEDGYTLQVKLEDTWYVVPGVRMYWDSVAIAHPLDPGTSVEGSYSPRSDLPAGTYRVVKEIHQGTIPDNTFVQRYLTAEFEIP